MNKPSMNSQVETTYPVLTAKQVKDAFGVEIKKLGETDVLRFKFLNGRIAIIRRCVPNSTGLERLPVARVLSSWTTMGIIVGIGFGVEFYTKESKGLLSSSYVLCRDPDDTHQDDELVSLLLNAKIGKTAIETKLDTILDQLAKCHIVKLSN